MARSLKLSSLIVSITLTFAFAASGQESSSETASDSGIVSQPKPADKNAEAEGEVPLLFKRPDGVISEKSSEQTVYINPLLGEPKKFEALEKQSSFHILRHKPIYFVHGGGLTKLQFSFRSPIVEDFRLYFGYSQIIFWETESKSKPFLDATYNPEFFYRFLLNTGDLKSIDWGLYEHQSNGKADEFSRSFDQTYVKANAAFEYTNWVAMASAKIAYMYGWDSANRDIRKYIGPLELQLRFVELYSNIVDKSEISLTARPGGRYSQDWGRGGYEFGYSFRLGGIKVVPAFYVQYYSGYGETLLTYDKKEDRVRFGLLF